jgi:hypothetical protein
LQNKSPTTTPAAEEAKYEDESDYDEDDEEAEREVREEEENAEDEDADENYEDEDESRDSSEEPVKPAEEQKVTEKGNIEKLPVGKKVGGREDVEMATVTPLVVEVNDVKKVEEESQFDSPEEDEDDYEREDEDEDEDEAEDAKETESDNDEDEEEDDDSKDDGWHTLFNTNFA